MLNADKLRGYIASAGMTQKELADKIGMSENNFSSKMKGKSNFYTSQAIEICKILNITDDSEKVAIFLPGVSQKQDTA